MNTGGDMENVLLAIIFGLCMLYIYWHIRRAFGKKSGSAPGCGGCCSGTGCSTPPTISIASENKEL
ncbi:MAG: FeoB-associated Cys-rich membrane protein [Magnetococcus sp. DMHC-6]